MGSEPYTWVHTYLVPSSLRATAQGLMETGPCSPGAWKEDGQEHRLSFSPLLGGL